MLKMRAGRNLQWGRKFLKPKRSHAPGPGSPNGAPPAPTHPREGVPGVEVGPAPRLRGLLQLPLPPPPPPSRRHALSPSRCSAGCHRRAKPGRRRAVPGLGVCCPAAPGPPPRRGRPFSTANSGQPARSEHRQAERSLAPCSAHRSVSLSAAGAPRAASSFLQPPSHLPKEAAFVPQGSAPRAKGAARGQSRKDRTCLFQPGPKPG